MASRDLKNDVLQEVAMTIQTINSDTTTNGEIIDTQGYESVTFILFSGTLTDGAYTPLIQDGDAANLSDAASVADAFLVGTEAEAALALTDDDSVKIIGYVGKKRYVRFNIVSASTSSGGSMGAIVVKEHARHNAVSNN